ncbi:MAG: NADH-quinone oxidoreductase subunit NuoE [Candidatus Abyssubacteria bacterium]
MAATRASDNLHERVRVIVSNNGRNTDSLIQVLQDIQSEFRYLPEDALRLVAQMLGLPLIQVYGVATFFKSFSLQPRGKHTCTVCLGTACHVRGAPAIRDELERQLGVKCGETTEDMLFTLESVNCLGACALGPVMVVDNEYHGQMNARKVRKVLEKYEKASRIEAHEEATVSG